MVYMKPVFSGGSFQVFFLHILSLLHCNLYYDEVLGSAPIQFQFISYTAYHIVIIV